MELNILKFFKNIKTSWVENIKYIFNLENLKNLFLLSLNTIKTEWKKLAAIFILFVLVVIAFMAPIMAGYKSHSFLGLWIAVFTVLINTMFVILIAAIRPSLERKNAQYFLSHVYPVVLFICIVSCLVPLASKLISYNARDLSALSYYISAGIVFNIFGILAILFLLDTKPGLYNYIKAYGRSILMYIYNLPGLILITLLVGCIGFLLVILGSIFLSIISFLFPIKQITIFVLIGIYLSALLLFKLVMITNFYKMRVHEQYSLYYSEPK